MEGSLNNGERRAHPRFIIDLPLEYRDGDGSSLQPSHGFGLRNKKVKLILPGMA